jgi:hypothetical protein
LSPFFRRVASHVLATAAIASTQCQGTIGPLQPGQTAPNHASAPASAVDAAVLPAADSCRGSADVGPAPLRRLTRVEYEHSITQVFGAVGDVSSSLAPDERIDGVFASNRSSSVALVQVRQYLDAAESIASKVDVLALDPCDRSASSDEACAAQFIAHVGRRAYRRPLDPSERDRYLTLYRAELAQDGYESALRLIVQTLLQSPHLLYHLELQDPATAAVGSLARLPACALASRLAYFFWSSAPDDALLDAADSGALDSDAGVLAQAQRMLADARARDGIESFHEQWLGLIKLDGASRDPSLFPEWTPELVTALRDETTRFSDDVIRAQAADYTTLLTASYSFPSGPGLAIRGISSAPSDAKVQLDPMRAVGILTQPAFLAAHSHTNQTSPAIRGRALRERFLCQPMPDPPPTVAAVPPPLAEGLTTRERFAMHRSAGSSCISCHGLIDDLGFALEHFDAIGRYRDQEQGKPIDASGELTDTDVDGPIDGAGSLAARFSSSAQAQHCYATQWFRYAVGRTETDADRCALQTIQNTLSTGGSIRDALFAITASAAFVSAKVEE